MRFPIDKRSSLASILIFIGIHVLGQSFDRCSPVKLSDTTTINHCYANAQRFFDSHDYLKAASYFHKAEKIIPNCPEILENLAACYWEHYQDSPTYDLKNMFQAKKYLEFCLHDRFIPKSDKTQYQNCLNEIVGVLDKILVQKSYGNGRYYGEMLNGKRDGFGVFYFNNGQRYEGLWIDDKKEDLEGVLYDSKNEILYKGVFYNDEKYDYWKPDLMDEIDYWKSIENSDDTTVFRQYLNKYGETGLYNTDAHERIASTKMSNKHVYDSISNSIDNLINQFSIEAKKSTKLGKHWCNFIDNNYSLSGYYSLRTGSVYPSRWGQYSSFGTRGNVINEGIRGINSLRYTIGALYAPTNWIYVYAGGGLSIDSLNDNDHINPTADLGLLFRLGVVSLSTGLQIDDFLSNPNIDFSFGFGLNFHKNRSLYSPFTYYVYSPMAPYGIMCAWYRNRISGYFKIQIPMYGEKIQQLIAPDYKDNPARFSYTAGATTSLTSWLGFYAGLGMGVYKDKLDDKTKKQGLDAEFGISLRASHYFSVTAGLHAVNITEKDRFLTYDVGIGLNTWKLFLKRANHTIFEYSYSETAKVGLMNGFINNWYGFYNRIQLTNPFQENKQHNDSDKWDGSRYSLTAGPMIALTDWLYIHGGIGMGLYRKDNYEKSTDIGFETELGVSLRAWLFDVSFGPHWCRVGKDDAFLDYNLGVGVNILTWMGGGYEDDMFMELRYSRRAQFGFNMGMLYDVGGWYFGMQGGIDPSFRMNLFAGAVLAPSALMHFKLGAGAGLYGTQLGFDVEAMYSFVVFAFPVTIGLKICRIGSPNMFIEPIYGLGQIGGL
jgi:hypothetical protein